MMVILASTLSNLLTRVDFPLGLRSMYKIERVCNMKFAWSSKSALALFNATQLLNLVRELEGSSEQPQPSQCAQLTANPVPQA